MAATIQFPISGVHWTMEELKDLLRAKLDDHDLLIELRTLHRGTHDEMRTLARGMTATLEDHERRLRVVERRQVYWIGCGAAVTVLAGGAFKLLGGKFGI